MFKAVCLETPHRPVSSTDRFKKKKRKSDFEIFCFLSLDLSEKKFLNVNLMSELKSIQIYFYSHI